MPEAQHDERRPEPQVHGASRASARNVACKCTERRVQVHGTARAPARAPGPRRRRQPPSRYAGTRAASCPAATTGSPSSRMRAEPRGVGGRRARPAHGQHPALTAAGETDIGQASGQGGGEDHRGWIELLDGPADDVGRRVAAEEGDPPAVLAEGDAEREQAEVVLLAARAGQHGPRPVAEIPAACQGEQAPGEDARGEVLARHLVLGRLPALADAAQHRQHDLEHHLGGRACGEQSVEQVVGRGRVEPAERLVEPFQGVVGLRRRPHGRRCLRGRQPVGQARPHLQHALLVARGVQPVAARRPRRREQAVALLPRPQHLPARARAAGELADPESLRRRHRYWSATASWSRAARPRLFAVPTGMPSSSATSR